MREKEEKRERIQEKRPAPRIFNPIAMRADNGMRILTRGVPMQ